MKWDNKKIDFIQALYETHTYEEIAEKFNQKFKSKKTPNAIRKAHERYLLPVHNFSAAEVSSRPKILTLDVETAPILGYVWGLFDQNVGLNQIHSDWFLLSWAAKWFDDPIDKLYYEDSRNSKNIEDDSKILKKLWKLLDEADIVLTQNGVKFDRKKINARFILNGMKPPSSYRHIDTLKIAKRHFGFTSNKLEYMTDKLCTKYKKSKHAKFSGFELWKQCLLGNKEAFKEMEEYNKMDILSLEELAKILLPWDNSINFNAYNETEEPICSCGSHKFSRSGFYYTNSSKFQKYRCDDCGSEYRDKTNLHSKDKRKSMRLGTVRR